MNKFKVGDRVAVYSLRDPAKGSVLSINDLGHLIVLIDGYEGTNTFHPKQCRRLVKKKRREFWVGIFHHSGAICAFNQKPNNVFGYDEIIKMREVKEKK